MALEGAVALRAEGLSQRLGGRQVLDRVDFELRRSEILGVLGSNGAGKTTLLRLLSGSLRAEGGTVWLGERDVTRWPLSRRAQVGIGYLPQGPSVFGGMTARDNVAAVLELRGRGSMRQSRDGAAPLLDLVGLTPRAEQRARTLSGGERRRLELAKLMALEPRVALLDEPLAGLDGDAAQAISAAIVRMSERGIGVALAEHRLQQAMAICWRACILEAGRVVFSGPVSECVERGGWPRGSEHSGMHVGGTDGA